MTDHWSKTTIGQWGSVIGGRQRSPHYKEGRRRTYLRVANVFEDRIDASDLLTMPFTDAEFERYRLVSGDILLNEGQSLELVGRSAIYKGDPPDCAFQNTLVRFRAGPDCDHRFAQHLFKQFWRLGVFRSIAKRTTSIAHLGVKRFASLEITVPPLGAQRFIANRLHFFDQITSGLRLLLEAKRKLKRGLTQQLLTGKMRFPEFSGKPWNMSRLGDHVTEVKRRNTEDIDMVLTASGEHGLVDQRRYFRKNVSGASLANYYLLRRGEFAYNRSAMTGYPFGATKRLDQHDQGILSTLYLCFAISDEALDSDFLVHVFDSGVLNKQLRPIVRVGARAHGLLNVTSKDYLNISIPFPTIEEQRRISRVLNSVNSEIDLLEIQGKNFEEYKRGLFARLLSGKLEVLEE